MTGFTSPWHIVVFALVVLLVFGTKRLPEIGRSMGTGLKEFKRSVTSLDEESSPPTLSTGAPDVPTADKARRASQRDLDTIA